jgi:hypothetical protein
VKERIRTHNKESNIHLINVRREWVIRPFLTNLRSTLSSDPPYGRGVNGIGRIDNEGIDVPGERLGGCIETQLTINVVGIKEEKARIMKRCDKPSSLKYDTAEDSIDTGLDGKCPLAIVIVIRQR